MMNKQVSSALLEKLPSEIQLGICRFLDPFPSMIAVAQTQRLLKSVIDPRQIRRNATYLERIVPGKLLYLTFREFRGVEYLASVQEEGNESSQQLLLSGSRLVVFRDHFGIFDLRCAASTAGLEITSRGSTYYSVLDLGKDDSKRLGLLAYSNVGRGPSVRLILTRPGPFPSNFGSCSRNVDHFPRHRMGYANTTASRAHKIIPISPQFLATLGSLAPKLSWCEKYHGSICSRSKSQNGCNLCPPKQAQLQLIHGDFESRFPRK